jgi:hypothetical protein
MREKKTNERVNEKNTIEEYVREKVKEERQIALSENNFEGEGEEDYASSKKKSNL